MRRASGLRALATPTTSGSGAGGASLPGSAATAPRLRTIGASGSGARATQAGLGVRATQAGLGVRATQAGLGARATQAGLGARATQAGHGARATQAGSAHGRPG